MRLIFSVYTLVYTTCEKTSELREKQAYKKTTYIAVSG